MKGLYITKLVIACCCVFLCKADAKESKCDIIGDLKIESYTYEPEVTVNADGTTTPVPSLNANGKPLFEPDGTPKYKLKSPLTINYIISGTYTVEHKDGTKDGPHPDYRMLCPTTVSGISPPENVTQNAADKIGKNVLNQLKNDLKNESCAKHECNDNNQE